MKKTDFFAILDGKFAEGGEIIDIMAAATNDPDSIMTERERCKIFMARYLFAAAVEATNRASDQFSIDTVDLITDFWGMAGEAIACVTVQAFADTPQARRAVRRAMKTSTMAGYDHLIELVDKYDTGATS